MSGLIPDPVDDSQWLVGSASEPVFGALVRNVLLVNVHSSDRCAGRACVVHNPSEHHMRGWPLNWRADRGLMERTCPHGTGHPDPDDLAYQLSRAGGGAGAHTCDGCCVDVPSWGPPAA